MLKEHMSRCEGAAVAAAYVAAQAFCEVDRYLTAGKLPAWMPTEETAAFHIVRHYERASDILKDAAAGLRKAFPNAERAWEAGPDAQD